MLSAVDMKVPHYFEKIKHEVVERDRGKGETGIWSTVTMIFQDDVISYVLGKQGATRKKLETFSEAVVQYVDHRTFFPGTRETRCGRRCTRRGSSICWSARSM